MAKDHKSFWRKKLKEERKFLFGTVEYAHKRKISFIKKIVKPLPDLLDAFDLENGYANYKLREMLRRILKKHKNLEKGE